MLESKKSVEKFVALRFFNFQKNILKMTTLWSSSNKTTLKKHMPEMMVKQNFQINLEMIQMGI